MYVKRMSCYVVLNKWSRVLCIQRSSRYMWPAERKPSTSRKYLIQVRGNFIRTGRFLNSDYCTKVLQGACTVSYWIMKSSCTTIRRYKLELAGRLVLYGNMWTAKACVFEKGNFTSFQSVYSCLSVSRHNVSPRFHHRCLFQLSFPTFELSFYKNTSRFYVTR